MALNDEYVVLANATLNKKWKPGWASTYQWGLNTPPTPTVSAGTSLNKDVDDFESLTAWSFTGGGATGNLQADVVHNRGSGTQSMRLTADAQTTITASKSISLDLSKFVTAGDIGNEPYLQLSYYTDDLAAIQSIVIKLSCAVNGAFTKDYYRTTISLGGYVYTTIAPTGEGDGSGTYESVIRDAGGGVSEVTYTQEQSIDYAPIYVSQPDGTYIQSGDPTGVTEIKNIIIKPKSRDIVSGSASWTDFKIPLSKFARIGDTAGRGWDTITAISIEVEASSIDADISFDDWKMVGGGNLFGNYWVAVAYQNDQGNYGPFTEFVGPVELDAQSLLITGLTPDLDGQTTQRRLAVLGGSLVQPMVAYLENNTATSYEFNDLESSLTIAEQNFNNRPPTNGIVDMIETNNRIFIVVGDNKIIYSVPGMYEAFPLKNYRTLAGGENLLQLGILTDGYVAARGKGREYITQITGVTPAYWPTSLGAKQGAVSSRLLLNDPAGSQVFMSEQGFYASGQGGRGEYLEKINPVITNPSTVFGDMIPDQAYLWFTDTSGIGRVMRIDYRLGRAVAHYVENMTPAAIFADNISNKVFYASGVTIYEFDADGSKLAATLTIPGQLCGSAKLKGFESLLYELAGAALTMTLTLDRVAQAGSYSLPIVTRQSTPVTLPPMDGQHLGLVLTSSAADDFTLYLPWIIDAVPIQ